jgi:hypothetical protein
MLDGKPAVVASKTAFNKLKDILGSEQFNLRVRERSNA